MHPNKKYKIAFVSNTAWSMYNFRLGIIKELKEMGHEVVVIAPKDTFTAQLISEGVSFRHIPLSSYGTNIWVELKTLFKFIRLYREQDFDLIFHYTIKPNIYGTIAAALTRTPSIIITTGLGHFLNFKNTLAGIFTLNLYRLAGRWAKEVWFLNKDDKSIFLSKGITDEKKSRLLNGEGINTTWYQPNGYVKKDKVIRFLFAGRVIWEKGIGEFVAAAKEIKKSYGNVEFQVLGFIDPANPNAVTYEQIVKWQKDNAIRYLGEATDVRPFLEQCDCLVFPSYYREGLSRILMEAASMERPIITTDNVGCKEVVEDGVNGFLVAKNDVGDLVEKIKKFLELSFEEKEKMGRAGREKVIRNFEESHIIDVYKQSLSIHL